MSGKKSNKSLTFDSCLVVYACSKCCLLSQQRTEMIIDFSQSISKNLHFSVFVISFFIFPEGADKKFVIYQPCVYYKGNFMTPKDFTVHTTYDMAFLYMYIHVYKS